MRRLAFQPDKYIIVFNSTPRPTSTKASCSTATRSNRYPAGHASRAPGVVCSRTAQDSFQPVATGWKPVRVESRRLSCSLSCRPPLLLSRRFFLSSRPQRRDLAPLGAMACRQLWTTSKTFSGCIMASRSETLYRRSRRPHSPRARTQARLVPRVYQQVSCLAAGLLRGHRPRTRDRSRVAVQAMVAAENDCPGRERQPSMREPQRGEGRKIAPGGARSLRCGRDDSKRAGPRPAVPGFFPMRAEHPTENVETPRCSRKPSGRFTNRPLPGTSVKDKGDGLE